MVFKCPRQECESFFTATYERPKNHDPQNTDVESGEWLVTRLTPKTPVIPDFVSGVVSEISPDFSAIYIESQASESDDRLRIAGTGYRKALEFLAKDYAIGKNPGSADEIRKLPLATVIHSYFEDARLREVAKRAVWLGNDETHYTKLWDKSLEDLKKVIRLTVYFIEMERAADSILEEMAQGK